MTERFFHPIITAKKQLPFSVRLRDIVLTILLWALFLYFMEDLFIFIADVARWAWHGFANAQDYKSFAVLPAFLSYLEFMGIFTVVYIGWARYNQIRFRGKSRRRTAKPVLPKDLADFYMLETRQVESWQQAKSLTIFHDNQGRIVKVE